MSYPILVEQFAGKQSMTIVCESCHAERVIGPDEISNEMLYGCPADCGGWAVYKYDEGTSLGGRGVRALGRSPRRACSEPITRALSGCVSGGGVL